MNTPVQNLIAALQAELMKHPATPHLGYIQALLAAANDRAILHDAAVAAAPAAPATEPK